MTTLHDTRVPHDRWMRVRAIDLDRATGTVGAVLADEADDEVLFVPFDRDGARHARPIEPGFSMLLTVIASVGARLRHVDLALTPAGLVLSDASAIRCDRAKALALALHAGVPVRLGDDVPSRPVVTAVPARTRPDAARLPA